MLSEVVHAVAREIAAMPQVPDAAVVVRHYHEWDAAKLQSLMVAVTPRGADVQNTSRAAVIVDYRVGIVVAKYAATEAEAEDVFVMAESILDGLRQKLTLSTGETGQAAFLSAAMDLSSDEMLNEQNIYRATIEATYKVLKGP
jgi:hypothetical protein